MSYKLDLRKAVANVFGSLSTNEILKIFKDKDISRATIYRVIKDCKEGKKQEIRPKSGRKKKLSVQTTKKLIQSAKNKVGQSTRRLGRKFKVSNATIHRILRRNNIFKRKRQEAPKYTAKQLEKIPKCCRALRLKHFANEKFIILDDESYFTFANHNTSGNAFFYTDDIETVPDNVRYAPKAKFEPKVLVWVAISSKGISTPYIRPIGGPAVDSGVYISKCLPKLVQFINKHHSGDDIMFWPDLASCHYSKQSTDWLKAQNIPFVPKADNPPNVPQARPIENFWANLKRAIYDKGWEATSDAQLVSRIKRKLKEMDISLIQALMRNVRSKLRKIEDHGPLKAL